jgi:hypothetical protein
MKSNAAQLESRGYIANGIENSYATISFEQRVVLLKSKQATERTLGARLLIKQSDLQVINCLIAALQTEKKLYPRLEICNSLVSYDRAAVMPLIAVLGKIGNNQHRIVPAADFKKVSYPLPRDLAARTLIRVGTVALPDLLTALKSADIIQLSEAIDAIGFICFYNYQSDIAGKLENCFYRNNQSELIRWKIFRAMSAFPESIVFLNEQLKLNTAILKAEIERSLWLIKNRQT